MTLTRSALTTEVSDRLHDISARLQSRARAGFTDASHTLESTCRCFFNVLFDWNLTNLNLEQSNFPGVDLADDAQRLALQITHQNCGQKITDTAEKFEKHNLGERFDKVIIFFCCPKKPSVPKYLKQAVNPPGIECWDIPDVVKRCGNFELSALKKALNILRQELGLQPHVDAEDLRIDINHLPQGAANFLAREAELKWLTEAWINPRTAVAVLVAEGGTGKTALIKRWLDDQRAAQWQGAMRVFGWSFYSQGTASDRQASEGPFLSAALQWFGITLAPTTSDYEKGRTLAHAAMQQRTLLVLDGLEPLQYPLGPNVGRLRAQGVQALLTTLASSAQSKHGGLCVITTRESVADLAEWLRPEGEAAAVKCKTLNNLSDEDGARLLHELGANKAGALAITADDVELLQACKVVKGHALSLSLLGGYLALAYGGDIRQWREVKFSEADAEVKGGHAFRVMDSYVTWLNSDGVQGPRCVAALRLLGFFDRPASYNALKSLYSPTPIAELTDNIHGLHSKAWRITLKRLNNLRLIAFDEINLTVDAHPLLREYFAQYLEQCQLHAWQQGHQRLFEYFQSLPKQHQPDILEDLQPLYQAIRHGCKAGLSDRALMDVYRSRIQRGDKFYSTKKLGAFADDLAAVESFFVTDSIDGVPQICPKLPPIAQTWLLHQFGFYLLALGRLTAAKDIMQAVCEQQVAQSNWKQAAKAYGNFCELLLTQGEISLAVTAGKQSVKYADKCQELTGGLTKRVTLAYALDQKGKNDRQVKALFSRAEKMQIKVQSNYPALYSLEGFRYAEHLLLHAEQSLWVSHLQSANLISIQDSRAQCRAVQARATQALAWAKMNDAPLLDMAVNHLCIARCLFYFNLLENRLPCFEAGHHVNAAVSGLRQAGQQDFLPRGLLTRAWIHHKAERPEQAKEDLDEAQRIAKAGGMRLHLADIALYRARLFRDREALRTARALIEQCGYGKRMLELEVAEQALGLL